MVRWAETLIDWEDTVEIRVYASLYRAEQIVNWRVERFNWRNVPTMVVLVEESNIEHSTSNAERPNRKDEFEAVTIEQIQVLRLVPAGASGRAPDSAREARALPGKTEYECVVEFWRPDQSNIALNVGASLTQVMRWAYWWNSTEAMPDYITTEQVLIELNTDFSNKGLASQDLQAIVGARQAGAISRDTMTEFFRRGEVLPEVRSMEEEEKLISWEERPTQIPTSSPTLKQPAVFWWLQFEYLSNLGP